jgi:DNA invertase Pin-like site-specific DNA recombinase
MEPGHPSSLSLLACYPICLLPCQGDIKVMVTLFGLFAEIERELISLRTKEALAAARAAGKHLGRPSGRLGHSKLDGKEADIRRLLGLACQRPRLPRSRGGPVHPVPLHSFPAPVTG